jgi:hypothetical protein
MYILGIISLFRFQNKFLLHMQQQSQISVFQFKSKFFSLFILFNIIIGFIYILNGVVDIGLKIVPKKCLVEIEANLRRVLPYLLVYIIIIVIVIVVIITIIGLTFRCSIDIFCCAFCECF